MKPQAVETEVLKIVSETAAAVTLRLGVAEPFPFRAGQAVTIDPHQFPVLADRIAAREKEMGRPEFPRAFSIASSPLETEFIEITIKKEVSPGPPPLLAIHFMEGLRPGDRIVVVGPLGKYMLPQPLGPSIEGIVYVSAGSGVAPNRGILKHCLAAKSPLRHLFVVQDRTRADAIYESELRGIAMLSGGSVRLVRILSRETAEGFERGHLSAALIRREMEGFISADRAIAFACGPNQPRGVHEHGFVDAVAGVQRKGFVGILGECGIPFERIITERW